MCVVMETQALPTLGGRAEGLHERPMFPRARVALH